MLQTAGGTAYARTGSAEVQDIRCQSSDALKDTPLHVQRLRRGRRTSVKGRLRAR